MDTPSEDEQHAQDAELIKSHQEVTRRNEECARVMKEMEATKILAGLGEVMREQIDAIEEEIFGRELPPEVMAELCRQMEDEQQVPNTELIKRHEELARDIPEIEAKLEAAKKDLYDCKLRREAEIAAKEANEMDRFGGKLPPGVMEELYKLMEEDGH